MSILSNTTVIVFDIETTGLNPLLDTVIEFGAASLFITLGTSAYPANPCKLELPE